MSSWIIALIFAIGVTFWAYNQLARSNGNASPRSNFTLAAVGGAVVFFVLFSLLKLVLHF